MYTEYYGFSREPFSLSPDPSFCYRHPTFAKAKAYFEFAIHRGEGFVVVTGRPGTGKTTLVQDLIGDLHSASRIVARIDKTQVDADDLLRLVAYAFGLNPQGLNKAGLLNAIEQFLLQRTRPGNAAILIVDEAQNLPPAALEELRLITNLCHETHPLVQIFLVGQGTLRAKIQSESLEQLHQRIVASCHLEPLNPTETRGYVEHRLLCAGWSGDPLIKGGALAVAFSASCGIPRLVNKFCARLLVHGYVEGRHTLTEDDARVVLGELRDESLQPTEAFEQGFLQSLRTEADAHALADLLQVEPGQNRTPRHLVEEVWELGAGDGRADCFAAGVAAASSLEFTQGQEVDSRSRVVDLTPHQPDDTIERSKTASGSLPPGADNDQLREGISGLLPDGKGAATGVRVALVESSPDSGEKERRLSSGVSTPTVRRPKPHDKQAPRRRLRRGVRKAGTLALTAAVLLSVVGVSLVVDTDVLGAAAKQTWTLIQEGAAKLVATWEEKTAAPTQSNPRRSGGAADHLGSDPNENVGASASAVAQAAEGMPFNPGEASAGPLKVVSEPEKQTVSRLVQPGGSGGLTLETRLSDSGSEPAPAPKGVAAERGAPPEVADVNDHPNGKGVEASRGPSHDASEPAAANTGKTVFRETEISAAGAAASLSADTRVSVLSGQSMADVGYTSVQAVGRETPPPETAMSLVPPLRSGDGGAGESLSDTRASPRPPAPIARVGQDPLQGPPGAGASKRPAIEAASYPRADGLEDQLRAVGLSVRRMPGGDLAVNLQREIQFAINGASVPERAHGTLHALQEVLDRFPDATIRIIGHTDHRGPPEYNRWLSRQRAEAVAAYLESQGLAKGRVSTEGVGEQDAQETRPGADELSLAYDRRIDVLISQR